MYHLDESAWPIVVVRVIGETTLDDMQQYADRLDSWLARGERFGIIAIVEDEPRNGHDKSVTRLDNDLWKRLRPQMAEWCIGYAGVAASVAQYARYKPLAAMAIPKRMGCIGDIFMTEDEARAWLRKCLQAFPSSV